jgi:hypothetical protein
VLQCPLLSKSGQILQRSEMTLCANRDIQLVIFYEKKMAPERA